MPRLGLLHADGFGEGRSGFFSDMEHWGIETFFTIATTAVEHTPALAGKSFVWPNFVNPEVFRDYGHIRNIEVLFTGNNNSLYPWRQKVVKIIPLHYRSVICSHPGYTSERQSRKIVLGEEYAMMLNASWLVPACGTVAKEIVRKHFEVPACRSCLVSERSPALDAAGFVDMKNCVFVDESDVVEKVGYLLENRDELQTIIDSGHKLVHSRHTIYHRDQVLQWFTLNQNRKPGQKIIQTNPFEPLQIVDGTSGQESIYIHSNGELVSLLRDADRYLWEGAAQLAEKHYLQCIAYYRYMPEALLGMTLCALLQGRPKDAMKWIVKPLVASLAEYNAVDPDPVEWAYFIVALLCLGQVRQASKRSQEFQWLHHPELDRVRWITSVLRNRRIRNSAPCVEFTQHRLTIHRLPRRGLAQWTDQLASMLHSCAQTGLAQRLKALDLAKYSPDNAEAPAVEKLSYLPIDDVNVRARRSLSRRMPLVLFRTDAFGLFKRRQLYWLMWMRLRRAAKCVLGRPLTAAFLQKTKKLGKDGRSRRVLSKTLR